MHIRLVSCLLLLMTAASLSHATEIEYVFTDDGKCRFRLHERGQSQMMLDIQLRDGDNWRELVSYNMPYGVTPKPSWTEIRVGGKRYTYIEYFLTDEPYGCRYRYHVMIETDDGHFRIYRTQDNLLQFDIFNHELWLFQKFSEVEIPNIYSFDLVFDGGGDLLVNLRSYAESMASQKLLSALEIEDLRKRELLARVGRTWPIASLLHRSTQDHETLNSDILMQQISPLLVLLDSGPSQKNR